MSYGCRKHSGYPQDFDNGCSGCNEEHPNHEDNPNRGWCHKCRQPVTEEIKAPQLTNKSFNLDNNLQRAWGNRPKGKAYKKWRNQILGGKANAKMLRSS